MRGMRQWCQLGTVREWGGGFAERGRNTICREENEFHLFLNVKKCNDGQETS